MPGLVIINYLAATEREPNRRRAAEQRRAHSALVTKAAAEERSPALRATRAPRPRHLVRHA
jgi:hypothetical protein